MTISKREQRTLKARSKIDYVTGWLRGLSTAVKDLGEESKESMIDKANQLEEASDLLRKNLE